MMGSRTRLGRVGPLLLFIGFIGWNSQLLGGLVVTLQPTSSTTMHVGETAFWTFLFEPIPVHCRSIRLLLYWISKVDQPEDLPLGCPLRLLPSAIPSICS